MVDEFGSLLFSIVIYMLNYNTVKYIIYEYAAIILCLRRWCGVDDCDDGVGDSGDGTVEENLHTQKSYTPSFNIVPIL